MLTAVINWSLHNRVIVLAIAALFAALGLWSLPELPIDAFPDTTPAQIQINTVAVGIGPLEVERQIDEAARLAFGQSLKTLTGPGGRVFHARHPVAIATLDVSRRLRLDPSSLP